ncbi:MAG: hypothetical protein D6754_11295, partial [Alphaproteobacteria bacterium]
MDAQGGASGRAARGVTAGPGISLPPGRLPPGPVAVILAEDGSALAETVAHCRKLGFAAIVLLRPPGLALGAGEGVIEIDTTLRGREGAAAALNALHAPLSGRWLHFCFNAEFLIYPYFETRGVADLISFMEEERRQAVFATLLDLYAGEDGVPDAVAMAEPLFDGCGYYGFTRSFGEAEAERWTEVYGGLRWRYEEFVPEDRRRIDRPGLYLAHAGLTIDADFRLSDPELNTVSCPWHHNVTAAVASFRAAKALRSNPRSAGIGSLAW